jgi:hypothetical protein
MIDTKDQEHFLMHDNEVPKFDLQVKNPLLVQLTELNEGEYIDVISNRAKSGNLLSSKIAMWKKHGKLTGKFTRRQIDDTTIRLFKIED